MRVRRFGAAFSFEFLTINLQLYMNYQQANFVKLLYVRGLNLNQIARAYFNQYGPSVYCQGPNGQGRSDEDYPAADGNDLKVTAEQILHTRF
jgi:hypothetical protein